MLDTVVFVDAKAVSFFTDSMVLAKIHAEQDTLPARKYHVMGYPTTLLLDKAGNEVDRLVGYAPPEEFLKTLVDYTRGIGTLGDLLRQADTATDRELFYQIGDKYKYRGESEKAETWFARVIESGEPVDSLSGEARLAVADLYRRAKDYPKALDAYRKISEEFTASYHGQDAVIYQAIVYRAMGDTLQAIAQFETYLQKFPESSDAEYAREQIAKLKNSGQTTQ